MYKDKTENLFDLFKDISRILVLLYLQLFFLSLYNSGIIPEEILANKFQDKLIEKGFKKDNKNFLEVIAIHQIKIDMRNSLEELEILREGKNTEDIEKFYNNLPHTFKEGYSEWNGVDLEVQSGNRITISKSTSKRDHVVTVTLESVFLDKPLKRNIDMDKNNMDKNSMPTYSIE